MSAPENTSGRSLRVDDGDPPPLSIELKKLSDLPKTSKKWSNVQLPVDILLLTVENCEFLACHYYLRSAFKSYSRTLGYVYFGNMGDQDKPWKVALVKCSKGSSDPGGSQTAVTNAVTQLRPKITFCVGFCQGLNHENTDLGDVVISCKLTTDACKTSESRDVGNLVRNAADGWLAPLQCPEAFREVKVHCDGEVFCPSPVSAEQQRKLHPEVIAVEMEGKGIFTAVHDLKSEWVVVKGVSHFVDSSANKSWETFASVMAASLVSNILSDPFVFEQWPHYGDISAGEESSNSCLKRKLPCLSDCPDAKRTRLADIHVDAFKTGKPSDHELDELAGKIAAVWEKLGIYLGISQDVLEEIAANAKDKPSKMLLRWRNTTTSATPYCDLYYALCHERVGLNNVAKEFCCKETTCMIHFHTVLLLEPGWSPIFEVGNPQPRLLFSFPQQLQKLVTTLS